MAKKEALKTPPKISVLKKTVFIIPVILSISWMFYLNYSGQIYQRYGLELLSPESNTTPLMIALMLFTIGYIIFLLLLFSENIKEFFARKARH